jgi:hypothetical protein
MDEVQAFKPILVARTRQIHSFFVEKDWIGIQIENLFNKKILHKPAFATVF